MKHERRPPSVELRIESEPGGETRTIRLSRGARAALVAALLVIVVGALIAAAVGPGAIAAMRTRREYDTQLGRRVQLGERLHVLVEELEELSRQGEGLVRRTARAAAVYGVEPSPVAPRAREGRPRIPVDSIYATAIARGEDLAAELTARLDAVDRTLASLVAWESAAPEQARVLPTLWPLDLDASVRTSGFGSRRGPTGQAFEFHAGLDLAAPAGTPIRAPADGQVVWAGEAPSSAGPAWWRLGKVVVLRHGERFLTLFGHCEGLEVGRGRRVRAGETLGTVGSSGWTPAPQLHYEVRRLRLDGSWQPIDPALLAASDEAAPAPRTERSPAGGGPPELPRALTP